MNKINKILISTATAIIALGSFASVALAQTPPNLVVVFENSPLFNEANFLPGSAVIRTVGVSNNSGSPQDIIVEAINTVDIGGLGDKLNLVIKEGDAIRYTGTLGAFLRAGEIPLSTLLTSTQTTYSFGVTFVSDAGNDTQNKTLGFDLCVGFSGGSMNCGDTVIGDEGGTGDTRGGIDGIDGIGGDPGGIISGTGGGGGGSSTRHLIITNERAININADGTIPGSGFATITWDTNLLATSQVVYGLASGSYTLVLTPPDFGYPLYNTEDSTKVINHSMLLTGLNPGQTYKYRVVSRASPATISYEHEFTVPIPFGSGNTITSGSLGVSGGEGGVLGASTGPSDNGNETSSGDVLGDSSDIASTSDVKNLAAAITSGWSDLVSKCSLIALLILLAGYLIWRFILRPRYEKRGLPKEKIGERFSIFFGLFFALAIVVAFVLGQFCPIPIFLIALLISLGLYVYNLVR